MGITCRKRLISWGFGVAIVAFSMEIKRQLQETNATNEEGEIFQGYFALHEAEC